MTADRCRIYLASGQNGGKRKKNLVWKKKYREVLLGKPLIWNTDRENVLLSSYEVLKIAYVAYRGIYFEPVILPHRVVLPLRASCSL